MLNHAASHAARWCHSHPHHPYRFSSRLNHASETLTRDPSEHVKKGTPHASILGSTTPCAVLSFALNTEGLPLC